MNPNPKAPGLPATAAPRPTANAPIPRDDPDDDDPPRWTPPPQWGPKGSRPFGPRTTTVTVSTTPTAGGRRTTKPPAPKVTSYNSDQIPTTTTDLPKEPVPFIATCGKKRYDEYDVSNALTAGCFYFKKGTKLAGTEFPKAFVNTQRFDFGDIRGQLMEFPLIESAPYISGMSFPLLIKFWIPRQFHEIEYANLFFTDVGDPGLDRVIFSTPDCFLAGELTMQGQTTGRYTECSEEY
jgi:hypothetical protein